VLLTASGCIYLALKARSTGLLGADFLRLARPRIEPFRHIAHQGFPAGLNMMTVALGIFVITYFVSNFGKEAVAAYGIGTRSVQIVLLPSIGLNIATLTLVAQNNGAGLFDRVRETLRTSLVYGAWVMALGTAVVLVLAGPMMRLFADDQDVIETGAVYLRIEALALYAYVLLFTHVAALQGIKRPLFAVWIGLFRQIIAPVAVFWLLTIKMNLPVTAIWWAIVVIVWTSALVALFYARRILARTAAAAADDRAP
jgi:Na+-driven multidrug efflux pump